MHGGGGDALEKIIYFDYCALIIICILLITTIFRKMTRGKQNRFFLNVMIVMLITAVADVFAITLDKAGAGNAGAKHIAHTVYLVTHMATTPCYISYLFTMTDAWHRLREKPVRAVIIFSPFAAGLLLMLFNPFTHCIYYLDEADTYTRGPLFIVLYLIAAVYVVMGIIHMCRHRKYFTRIQFMALFSVFPVNIIVAAIQFFLPDYVVEMFASATVLILVSETVQRPENLLDPDTGLLRHSAYITKIRNTGLASKHVEIIMLNIVNFPVLRDMLGYEGTNDMLKKIADELTLLSKSQDTRIEYFHLGQGKFRIIVEHSRPDVAARLADSIYQALRPGFLLNHMTLNLVTHVCILNYPEDIDDPESLIAFGNDLSKLPVTGGVIHASDVYRKEYYDIQRDIDMIIEEALTGRKFEVYYQPIYSVTEQRFNSAEALLRLRTEKYGFISPEVLVSAAEKSGAIHMIGRFVIEEVCRFIASEEFRKLGIDYIEVNLSVVQCMQNNLAQEILDILSKYHIRPEQINLEITETTASYSQNTMVENLQTLADAGVSFALDDFGTGYSNMYRIASLPFHLVKLDKSFTDLENNKNLLIVLKNTIRMIKDMNMKIVVEGIETKDMVNQFAELRCEYIQGYYYSKPIPRNEFVKFIESARASKHY